MTRPQSPQATPTSAGPKFHVRSASAGREHQPRTRDAEPIVATNRRAGSANSGALILQPGTL